MSPSRRRRGRGGKPTAQQLRDFWGEDVDDPVDAEPIRVITPGVDPTALVESLGPLPFPGAGLAHHYFQAVYERTLGEIEQFFGTANVQVWGHKNPNIDWPKVLEGTGL